MIMSKRKKQYISVIFIVVIIFLGVSFRFYYDYVKAKKVMYKTNFDYYNNIVKSEQKWLFSLQLSNGALPFRGKENGTASIVPYFSSITAIALLEKTPDTEYSEVVKEYLDWHFAHLNHQGDINGIVSTIYDYNAQVENGTVISEYTKQEYDSVDSYAALFLVTIWKYYEQTGNKDYLIEHYPDIVNVIHAMNSGIDSDGLSYAKPNYQVKYLMDNTEVYQGISSSINLMEQVFLSQFKKGTSEYKDAQQTITVLKQIKNLQENAFENTLWNNLEKRYEIGYSKDKVLHFSSWKDFYPDAVAQLFPIAYGLIDPDSEKARHLYQTFSENFKWEEMDYYESGENSFYWGIIAYSAALMRDEKKVKAYLDEYINKVKANHDYPAYNADVARVVLASAEMAKFYQEKMRGIDLFGIVNVK